MEELAIGCRTPCLHPIREKVSGRLLFAQLARNLWAISKDLTNSDSEMRRFESRRPSQPVRLQRVTYERSLKNRAVPRGFADMSGSPCAEFGNGGAIPASCLSGTFFGVWLGSHRIKSQMWAPPAPAIRLSRAGFPRLTTPGACRVFGSARVGAGAVKLSYCCEKPSQPSSAR
jgi:hypothetical protein